jgi:hypothetical protein
MSEFHYAAVALKGRNQAPVGLRPFSTSLNAFSSKAAAYRPVQGFLNASLRRHLEPSKALLDAGHKKRFSWLTMPQHAASATFCLNSSTA